MRLSHIVQNLRIERGMGREELARKCGLNRSSMIKIENGASYPTLSTQKLIAEALGVTVKSLTDPSVCPLCGHVVEEEGA